jgi:membrane protease YdiL (CAAX protease family)
MRKSRTFCASLNNQETVSGLCYLAFQLTFLPGLLTWGNQQLSQPLNSAEQNFVYYLVNFLAMLLIFHHFLGSNASHALHHPIQLVQSVILGLAAYYACFYLIEYVADFLLPAYSNYNDEAISAMSRGNYFLMFIGTVILVPPVEECFYRGLVFRNLYGKSPVAAYIISILAFASIHIVGYIGQYSALELLVAVLQYLPAGLWLAWSYTKSGTIFAPIFIHAAVNFLTIRNLR